MCIVFYQANDAYLEIAIGNAPWPIGVTMVGIHARTGREKIFARNVAHVLNDETQRKYIQVKYLQMLFSNFDFYGMVTLQYQTTMSQTTVPAFLQIRLASR